MRQLALLTCLVLAACGGDDGDTDKSVHDARDVALIEKANNTLPPIEAIEPEPLGAPEIERYDLLGAACAYAPGTSLGARVIAREADAFVKINGEVERFSADAGSRQLPQHSRSLYNSKTYSLRLLISPAGTPSPDGKQSYEGTVEIRDAHGRMVYEGTGLARCGP